MKFKLKGEAKYVLDFIAILTSYVKIEQVTTLNYWEAVIDLWRN